MKDAGTRPDSTEDPPVCWPVHMKSVMDQTSLDWCGSRRKPAQNPQLKIMKLSFHFEATRELFGDRPSNFEQSPFARIIPEPTLLPKLPHHISESLEPMTLPPGHMCSKLMVSDWILP
uniref:Uncharacterized protein n=1 Tax=Araneus ventricosus TaxID=182803 RepID=A0A4Y2PR72_ARAVE|nr:hypothetical protein AVEN_34771-1 [Araneus ventricosus]GBN52747.1 hypothetical protein AVEN_169382-1 [Araneus ventricosus]